MPPTTAVYFDAALVFEALQGQFHHDVTRGLWTPIEPTLALLQQVRSLFARLDRSVFLRSLDTVHLTTAKAARFDRLYSNVAHLLAACPSDTIVDREQ